jgi:GNAT superfamily N-acetyltransferase
MATTVREAGELDAQAACDVLRRSIAECCTDDHQNEPVLLEAWLSNKTPDNVRAWLRVESSFGVVAETDGVVVGFAMLLASGEIPLCYLVPEARFQGVGKSLLGALEMEARRRGIGELYLESTKTAHAFYLRNGFLDSGAPEVAFGIEGYPMRKQLAAKALTGSGTST